MLPLVGCSVPHAEYRYFNLTKSVAEVTGPGNNNILVESNEGTWWGFPRSQPDLRIPEGATEMGMRFEFITDNYFTNGNKGHFAVGIRGDGYNDLLGRGIVIGNVTELAGDSATSQPAAIAIESFWTTGNAVYGKAGESVELKNNTHYRVSIVSKGERAETIGYTLEKKVEGHWVKLATREMVDYKGIGKTDPTLGGWFIAEVFSTHSWKFNISNLTVWYE